MRISDKSKQFNHPEVNMNYNKNINILAVSTITLLTSMSTHLSANEKQIYQPRLINPALTDQVIFFQQQQQKQSEAIIDMTRPQTDTEFKYIF